MLIDFYVFVRVKKVVPKSAEAVERIDQKLKTNFLFAHLDEDGRKQLCDAVFEANFSPDTIIIRQVRFQSFCGAIIPILF